MARNGSGTYQPPAGQPVVTGTSISSTVFNTLVSDLANALTTSVASDGQTPMTGNLPMGGNKVIGLAAAAANGDAVCYEQINNGTLGAYFVPSGALIDYAGVTPPAGFLLCDGSAVSRATYAALFAAISTTWGAGDGSTTFNVPDLRGQTTIGSGTGTGLTARTVGATYIGEERHVLTTTELAAHNHPVTVSITDPTHVHAANDVTGNTISVQGGTGASVIGSLTPQLYTTTSSTTGITATGSATNTGSGTAHNNMQPSAVVNKIIKT